MLWSKSFIALTERGFSAKLDEILTLTAGIKPQQLPEVQIATISKSSLRAPHSGHVQFIGTSSQRVPGAIPSSGKPASSS
jgi:hypothetical protein